MIRWVIVISWLMLAGMGSVAQTVQIAVANNMDFAMREIVTAFEAENPGIRVTVQLGASGNLFNQIQQGLPVDMFFSADTDLPERLAELGFAEPNTVRPYAQGRLVVWVSDRLVSAGLDPEALGVAVLTDPRVTQLAIASPVVAPYGRAAVTFLEYYDLIEMTQETPWERMTDGVPAYYDISQLAAGKPGFTFIYGENISQAAQLAMTAADVGILALALAISDTMQQAGSYWLAPLESHIPIEQAYLIIEGQDRPEVRAFYNFIGSDIVQEILERYGFILPSR